MRERLFHKVARLHLPPLLKMEKRKMNKVKLVFCMAAIVFAGFITCLAHILQNEPGKNVAETMAKGIREGEDAESQKLAEDAAQEIRRFKDSYGLEISLEDMLRQLEIRQAYMEAYGSSYDLEDVFIISGTADEEGDPDAGEIYDMLDEIEETVRRFGIDESKYDGMDIAEEWSAIRDAYGNPHPEVEGAHAVPEEDAADGSLEDMEGAG